MPTFFPPIHSHVPRFHPDDPKHMQLLRARQAPVPSGMNIWITNDNVVTIVQPYDTDIKRWFQGGAYHDVTEEEAALLRSAGYPMLED